MSEERVITAQQEEKSVQIEQTEQKSTQEPSGLQDKKKKLIPLVVAAAVVFIALLAGVSIYNTPANRLQRQLDLGNKYLEEQQYEQAALAFEQAIVIDDRCLEAYAGGIEAYLGAGDTEGAQDFYDKALAMLSGLDADFLAENMDYAVEIYLAADKVYSDDWEKIAQVLEEGYTMTGENSKIKDKLIENYIQIGKKETQEGSYQEALTVYDRLLELDSTNEETINGLCDCLNKYINVLMEAKQYDEVRALAEKYGDVAVNVDFNTILARITELERIEAENRAFMQKVYDLMAAEDYEGMHEVDGSEEAGAFVERMESDRYIYCPDDNDALSGTGAGVYTYGMGGYYFYYGDYVNNERKGNGVEFQNKSGDCYFVFTGEWSNDAPNGEGEEITVGGVSGNGNGMRYDTVTSGVLIDGLWDGNVNAILTDKQTGEEFDLSFSAAKGIPAENKTEKFISEGWWDERLVEGWYIYTFDHHPDTGNAWWSLNYEGGLVGITGFGE